MVWYVEDVRLACCRFAVRKWNVVGTWKVRGKVHACCVEGVWHGECAVGICKRAWLLHARHMNWHVPSISGDANKLRHFWVVWVDFKQPQVTVGYWTFSVTIIMCF